MKTLQAVLEESFNLLAEGASGAGPNKSASGAGPANSASGAGSPWRYPALATLAPDNRPMVRTVVLRQFQAAPRIAELHTDARSPKMAALALNRHAALHVWDSGRRIQLRLDGTIAAADVNAEQAAWDALHDGSRASYFAALPPGTPIADPDAAGRLATADEARRNFRVLEMRYTALEYLSLARLTHCRASFRWRDEGCDATWLVP